MSSELASNVKRYRLAAGFSQESLAEAAGLSVKTVQKVEQGGDARTETLHTLARALKVTTSELFAAGSPAPVVGDEATRRNLVAFRSILMPPLGLDGPVGTPAGDGGAAGARQQVAHALSLYRASELDSVARALPGLLQRTQTAVTTAEGEEARQAATIHAEALYVAGKYLTQVRQYDLAYMAIAEGIRVARTAGHQHLATIGVVGMGWLLLRQNRFGECYALAVATAERVEPKISEASRTRMAVWAELWMRAAAAAVRDNRPDEAKHARKMVSRAVAGMESEDDSWPGSWGGVGPITAELKRVEDILLVSRNSADAREVLDRADEGVLSARARRQIGMPSGSNWVRHRLVVASAHTLLGAHQDAMDELIRVRRTRGEWMRHQPLARKVMGDILKTRSRTLTADMREVAAHLGVSG
ncbi:helix-turn-helix transcriptional regulator [Streptomyces mobaraensis NBRC 13819 = DSM 40847]|uniref:Uncharacterized protein n=1 Tax=Streptomyces mobaraensis (strain ATCC 29032 / DSM 40847 / JCM 4168 / NBRC 13819 / NCIMB 11159 / IPCR 16-22) TaxID=1223523 RepID=M3C9T5_STRM1|nr:helix-turn-helix transcriptional regulator [Streptomyces mobaraensis]EMF00741.1 hypothetical protein H340_09680 [Streptomyces mobaraensis NBRC 13819 = DSM 40847]QTT76307.1 helix-turn-helix transcriptional regulator [Streptomyces mobaraensis NBRC 13819 = DSM 40847]